MYKFCLFFWYHYELNIFRFNYQHGISTQPCLNVRSVECNAHYLTLALMNIWEDRLSIINNMEQLISWINYRSINSKLARNGMFMKGWVRYLAGSSRFLLKIEKLKLLILCRQINVKTARYWLIPNQTTWFN